MISRTTIYLTARTEPASAATDQLEREGYTVVKSVFTPEEVTKLKQEINQVFDLEEPDERGPDPGAWSMFRYAMLNRSEACQKAVGNRGILNVIEPLLGEDCHVIANTAWRNPPTPGDVHGGEYWHIDAGPHIPLEEGTTWPSEIPHPVFAIGTHIFLQDCRIEDGPTGVIPGSHLSGQHPPMEAAQDDHLEWNGVGVHPLIAKAGDVAFFVSDIWHRRMPSNADSQGRFFLQVHYGRRDIAQRLQPTQEVNHLSDEAIRRAETKRDRSLIGLHGRGFYDG